MKFLFNPVVACVPLLLSACGGGGSDSAAAISAPAAPAAAAPAGVLPSGLDVTEFLGAWTRDDSTWCYNAQEYGNYSFKGNTIVVTANTFSSTLTYYTDRNCTAKAGKLTETAAITYSAGSLPGKTNVVRVSLNFTGFTTSADGGSGLTFTKIPDGTATGTEVGVKVLMDVDNGKLYVSSEDSTVDSSGYPTSIDYTTFAFFNR